ncbi:MAG: PDGLE domain-containing protein [Dehalococcoidia bacterium]|nr:PDGLE domain-containing protein [Dehalococcoidia bacterium]MDD5495137.1 PDGLE domain-containing protein [Dehalococcoidia bacterium]
MKAKWWIIGLAVALLLAIISPIASSFPDGLEKVAQDHEFAEKAGTSPFSVMSNYIFPGIENEALATVLAGVLGTIILFSLGFGIASILKSKNEA